MKDKLSEHGVLVGEEHQQGRRTPTRAEETIEKQFDAVKFMRQQRDRLSEKLSTMTKDEIVAYFKINA